ncbi:hypothetical protein K1T71_009017 [Dendrolimus kikuchii]|uniref:Uncharacterized protein n=1 Tax=Dendrolimus kikuchii TaxID=765133 RepID=A0ACC1CWY9_9NEOP|nr:hypothetical protein K1T71_009017 [Dendrolimus kikuchii]
MFVLKTTILCAAWLVLVAGQQYENTTPVPILKQINKQNDDGSYSFGYEAADGSFKIETKYPNGDVAGKYGYIDVNGKTREVSYGAGSQRGFEPQGTGIMVPPPTIHDPSSNTITDGQEDDGQYREDPRIYEDSKYNGRTRASHPRQQSFSQFSHPAQPVRQQPEPQYQQYQSSDFQSNNYQPSQLHTQAIQSNYQQPQPAPYRAPVVSQQASLYKQSPQTFPQGQSQVYHQQPQFSYQAYTPQPYQSQNYQPQNYQSQNYQNQNYNPFFGHPAQNFDPSTGSYTINFTG